MKKFLADFFPVLLFFIAAKLYDNYVATAVSIAASLIQVSVYWLIYKRFEKVHLITLAILVIMGGATILLHNDMFIKWKPSVVNWIFALVLLGSQFIGNKNILERMLGGKITLPALVWLKLNISCIIFFLGLGLINLYVVYNFDNDTWLNFKLFGMMGLNILFFMALAIYMSFHMQTSEIENK